jgi:hypothetical protein
MKKEPLLIDVMKDVRKVDRFVTQLINDKGIQKRFFKNPSKVMIELGFHPPTTDKAIKVSNRIFYATLTNKKLTSYVAKTVPSLKIPNRQRRSSGEDWRKDDR